MSIPKKTARLLGLVVVVACQLRPVAAEETGMDRSAIVGTWEALDPSSMRLFVAEIGENSNDSYITMMSSEVFLFAVHSIAIDGHRVELLADGRGNAAQYSLKVNGAGWAGGGEGLLDATIALRDADGRRILRTWKVAFHGYRGKFIESICEKKRLANEAIAGARRDAKQGPVAPSH